MTLININPKNEEKPERMIESHSPRVVFKGFYNPK